LASWLANKKEDWAGGLAAKMLRTASGSFGFATRNSLGFIGNRSTAMKTSRGGLPPVPSAGHCGVEQINWTSKLDVRAAPGAGSLLGRMRERLKKAVMQDP